ncbi:MAG: magnesium and cobalt transport protein CorA [Sphingobium sp.]|nr:magnesium and cobalt transport protein CorA [Sphingobium sp.]
MTVVSARRYRNGVAVDDIELADRDKCTPPGDHEFVWIGLVEPSPDELATVADRFGLHPLAVEDAQMERQLPKAEQYGDQLFLVLRTAHLEEERIAYGQTAIFLGPGFIVTVRQGSARAHSDLRAHLEAAPSALAHGPDYVLHSIMDFIVDGYFPIVEQLEDEALTMESTAEDHFLDRDSIVRIFTMRREVVRFQRVLGVMIDVAARLANVSMPQIDTDMRPYFRDVYDHIVRAEYRLGGLREILTSVVETSNLLEMQRQGDNTRRLAAWAGLLAVPTAIAGIYGMNFKYMPELEWRYGYDGAVGLMAAICLILYWRFRRSGWL